MNVREQRALRRATRDADPISYAVLQSVEYGTVVHVPYSAEAMRRYREIADAVEIVPERRDLANGALLSLRSVIFRGDWWDGGKRFCVRVDDVPTDYEVEVL